MPSERLGGGSPQGNREAKFPLRKFTRQTAALSAGKNKNHENMGVIDVILRQISSLSYYN